MFQKETNTNPTVNPINLISAIITPHAVVVNVIK